MKAIETLKKKRCGACDEIHDSDRCYPRGLNFLPPLLRKKILLFNEQNGDKPKVPPVDAPRARTASFALQQPTNSRRVSFALQQRALQLRGAESGDTIELDLHAMSLPAKEP